MLLLVVFLTFLLMAHWVFSKKARLIAIWTSTPATVCEVPVAVFSHHYAHAVYSVCMCVVSFFFVLGEWLTQGWP